MGALKIVAGLAFIGVGILIMLIAIIPLPFLPGVSLMTQIINTFTNIMIMMTDIMSLDLTSIASEASYYGFSTLILTIGYKFMSAGISSMRKIKREKPYFLGKVKVHFLIMGFIILIIAVTMAFTYFTDYPLSITIPGVNLDLIPPEYHFLIPQLFLPVMIVMLLIAFLYFLGRIFMSRGVEKEKID